MLTDSLTATNMYSSGLGVGFTQDSNYYFENSGAQYATLNRFALTQKMFGADPRFGGEGFGGKTHAEFLVSISAVIQQNGGTLSVADLKTILQNPTTPDAQILVNDFKMDGGDFRIGLTQPNELIGELLSEQMDASEFTDWTYVYGTSGFGIDDATTITVGANGLQLDNALVIPNPTGDEDFDFNSSGNEAGPFNAAWADDIAPSGQAFDIDYDNSHAANYTVSGFNIGAFNIAAQVTATHIASNEALAKQWWADNYQLVFDRFKLEDPEHFVEMAEVNGSGGGPGFRISILGALVTTHLASISSKRDSEGVLHITKIITAYFVEQELESDLGVSLDIGELVTAMLDSVNDGKFWGFEVVKCFPAGTQITNAVGSSISIENIRTGDMVLSHDTHGNSVYGRVTQLLLLIRLGYIR